jgi:hydrogenase maturation protein HypF
MLKRQKIRITGTVQGVGFRPAVYRLAQELALAGFVYNDSIGVVIDVQGPKEKINQLV